VVAGRLTFARLKRRSTAFSPLISRNPRLDDKVVSEIICRHARIAPLMHCYSAVHANFLLGAAFPVVDITRERALANRHVVQIGQTQWVMPVGRSLVTSLAAHYREFIGVRLTLLKHVNFLWYIFSSRWKVVIREASNPPWAGRRGGIRQAAPRFAAAVLG
jgi:hypothetical protein